MNIKNINMKKWYGIKKMMLRKYITMFRLWLLERLLTEDEKYLIIRAIEDRVANLERIAVNEKWADKDNISMDIWEYLKLKTLLSTRDWV